MRKSLKSTSIDLKMLSPKYLTLAIALVALPVMQSCDDPVHPNALNAEQQAFKDLLDPANPKMIAKGRVGPSIIDGQPVVSIPVSPVPNNLNFTEAFKGFMDIELRVIDARAGSYSITPIINRSSVEKILKKAEELEPGKEKYVMSLVNQALLNSVKRDLTTGVEISDRDDNNPATRAPAYTQLPERFTVKEFLKYYTNANTLTDSFILNKGEAYNMIMDVATFGSKFDTVVYPVAPIAEAQSIVRN